MSGVYLGQVLRDAGITLTPQQVEELHLGQGIFEVIDSNPADGRVAFQIHDRTGIVTNMIEFRRSSDGWDVYESVCSEPPPLSRTSGDCSAPMRGSVHMTRDQFDRFMNQLSRTCHTETGS